MSNAIPLMILDDSLRKGMMSLCRDSGREVYRCHPDTWDSLKADERARFELKS